MISVLLSILALGVLMIVHEGGHYLAARAYGMRVITFSIGFGPPFFKIYPHEGYFWLTTTTDRIKIRLWRHDPEKHGPTVYQVAMIPFFAYVRIAGMNPMEEADDKDKGSYANASLFGRIVTIFGGPLANYLFASVFFFVSFFFGGRVVMSTTTDVNVISGRPADVQAHIQDGDRIVEIAGVTVKDWNHMAEVISKHPGEAIPIVVERKGERISSMVTPGNDNGKGKIGVAPIARRESVSAKEAAILSVTEPPKVVGAFLVSLRELFAGNVGGRDLTGPIGIVRATATVMEGRWTDAFGWLGVLSAFLGAVNLVPFPPLDGARLMFLAYEATTRRRAPARIEVPIFLIGAVVMLGIMFYVTANDIRQWLESLSGGG